MHRGGDYPECKPSARYWTFHESATAIPSHWHAEFSQRRQDLRFRLGTKLSDFKGLLAFGDVAADPVVPSRRRRDLHFGFRLREDVMNRLRRIKIGNPAAAVYFRKSNWQNSL